MMPLLQLGKTMYFCFLLFLFVCEVKNLTPFGMSDCSHLLNPTPPHSPSAPTAGQAETASLVFQPLSPEGNSNLPTHLAQTPLHPCEEFKTVASPCSFSNLFRFALDLALLSQPNFIMWVRNLFISSWCICDVTKSDMGRKGQAG